MHANSESPNLLLLRVDRLRNRQLQLAPEVVDFSLQLDTLHAPLAIGSMLALLG